MKALIITLLLAALVFADAVMVNGFGIVSVPDRDVALVYSNEFNSYPVNKLTRLSDSQLNGILDTNKTLEEMVLTFINTTKIGKEIAGASVRKLPKRIGGMYKPGVDSIYISSDIKDKKLAMYVIIHELTHAIQFKNGMYTSGRKTLIVNELYADYSAARLYLKYFNEKSYRQTPATLSMYFDRALQTPGSFASKMRVLSAAYVSITRRIYGPKEAKIQRESLRKAISN